MFKTLFIAIFLTGCQPIKHNKISIPKNSCRPKYSKLIFQETTDLDSILNNIELLKLYYKKQTEQMKLSIQCYENIIDKINN